MIVIYHASCHDGFCAAWLLHKIYPDATFLPTQYGDAAPDVSGHDVIIADFSFDTATMVRMIGQANSLICFDHHKTMPEVVRILPEVVFDKEKSGARLVWEYFIDDLRPLLKIRDFQSIFEIVDEKLQSIPWLVRYTEDRDLWRFALPDSRQVNSGLRMLPFEFEAWDRIGYDEAWEVGTVLESYFDNRRDSALKKAVFVDVYFNGGIYSVPCVNETNHDLISIIGEALAMLPDAAFGMTYFYHGANREFVFSLRSRDGFDVSEIAQHYGGGGHQQAAGFRRKEMFDLSPLPSSKQRCELST